MIDKILFANAKNIEEDDNFLRKPPASFIWFWEYSKELLKNLLVNDEFIELGRDTMTKIRYLMKRK